MQQYTLAVPDNLLDNILKLKETVSTGLRSNILGWQSPQYTSTTTIPWATDLVNDCLKTAGITEPAKHVWFNVNGKGAHHKWHSHGGASVVGVFYISVPEDSGDIEFRDGTSIKPHPGMLLIFPAGVEHRVLPNQTAQYRISMAFNINS
jgi:hypothetical protein